ncbi:NADH dehydrogenase ubiquinone Fe-S protein 4 [Sphingomonas oryzagri]
MSAVFRSMRALHDRPARELGPGPDFRPVRSVADGSPGMARAANDNSARAPALTSALPADALAIIEQMSVATHQGGRARRGKWRVRFAERARPFVDPLTGWTGGCDPLAHVELRFSSLAAAERYCHGQQLRLMSASQRRHSRLAGLIFRSNLPHPCSAGRPRRAHPTAPGRAE